MHFDFLLSDDRIRHVSTRPYAVPVIEEHPFHTRFAQGPQNAWEQAMLDVQTLEPEVDHTDDVLTVLRFLAAHFLLSNDDKVVDWPSRERVPQWEKALASFVSSLFEPIPLGELLRDIHPGQMLAFALWTTRPLRFWYDGRYLENYYLEVEFRDRAEQEHFGIPIPAPVQLRRRVFVSPTWYGWDPHAPHRTLDEALRAMASFTFSASINSNSGFSPFHYISSADREHLRLSHGVHQHLSVPDGDWRKFPPPLQARMLTSIAVMYPNRRDAILPHLTPLLPLNESYWDLWLQAHAHVDPDVAYDALMAVVNADTPLEASMDGVPVPCWDA